MAFYPVHEIRGEWQLSAVTYVPQGRDLSGRILTGHDGVIRMHHDQYWIVHRSDLLKEMIPSIFHKRAGNITLWGVSSQSKLCQHKEHQDPILPNEWAPFVGLFIDS